MQGIWLLRETIDSTTKATCTCQDLPTNTTLRAQSLKDSHCSVRVRRYSSFLLTVSRVFRYTPKRRHSKQLSRTQRSSKFPPEGVNLIISSYNQARYSDNLETKLYLCKEHSLIFDMNMKWNVVNR